MIRLDLNLDLDLDLDSEVVKAKQLLALGPRCCNRLEVDLDLSAPAVVFYLLYQRDHWITGALRP